MDESELRRRASDALRAVRDRVDATDGADALEAIRSGRGRPETTVRHKARWWIAAAATVVVCTGALVWLASDTSDQIRTAATPPLPSVPAATPTATSLEPSAAPVTTVGGRGALNPPAGNPFGGARYVATGPDGVSLSSDLVEWTTVSSTPASGPAYLVDELVVTQGLDPSGGAVAGAITITSAGGDRDWAPPGPARTDSGSWRYRLFDAAPVDDRPTMLVGDTDHSFPDDAFDRLLLVDLHDGAITELGNYGGWESAVISAVIADGRVYAVVTSGVENHLVEIDIATHHTVNSTPLRPDTAHSVSATADGVVTSHLVWDDGASGSDLVVDPPAGAWGQRRVAAGDSCSLPYYDGVGLWCGGQSPHRLDTYTGELLTVGPAGSVVRPRRDAPPPTVAVPTDTFAPFVDDDAVCVPAAARERITVGEVPKPFAYSGAGWHRFQVVADPSLGPNGPFAFVGTTISQSSRPRPETVGGVEATFTVGPHGSADASITLPDGTDAYVRSYGFDEVMLRDLVSGLVPRSAEDGYGFELGPVESVPNHRFVIDEEGDTVLDYSLRILECERRDEAIFRIGAIAGDPLAEYVITLDQPLLSEVGTIGDSVVSVGGGATTADIPTLADVRAASAAEWETLLQA